MHLFVLLPRLWWRSINVGYVCMTYNEMFQLATYSTPSKKYGNGGGAHPNFLLKDGEHDKQTETADQTCLYSSRDETSMNIVIILEVVGRPFRTSKVILTYPWTMLKEKDIHRVTLHYVEIPPLQAFCYSSRPFKPPKLSSVIQIRPAKMEQHGAF